MRLFLLSLNYGGYLLIAVWYRQSVLESVGGDQDSAIDALLGMSDPEYRSDSRPVAPVLVRKHLISNPSFILILILILIYYRPKKN